jgi:stage III sporulation protein SpoIIIAA
MMPDAIVISDEAGRALDVVSLVEALPETLKK